MSVFWGLGINCLIEFFQNDVEKIVHAFYPLFKTWVQQDDHNLKKLSDLSISIRRWVSVNWSRCFQTCFLVFLSNIVSFYSAFFRLVVTENAQCYLWNQWCSTNKKARNAKISHMENPARSDAVKFFLHVLDSDTYSSFNFKATLYNHFQLLLSTPHLKKFSFSLTLTSP